MNNFDKNKEKKKPEQTRNILKTYWSETERRKEILSVDIQEMKVN